MPDNYARRAYVAFLPPLKLHVLKKSNMSYGLPLPKEFKFNFVIHLTHLSGEKFTFMKVNFYKKIIFPFGKTIFLEDIWHFQAVKKLPIGN